MYQNLIEIFHVRERSAFPYTDRRIIRYEPDAVIGDKRHSVLSPDLYDVDGVMILFEIEDV